MAVAISLAVTAAVVLLIGGQADASAYEPISGSGTRPNLLDQWRRSISNLYGITVNYSSNGSTSGRNDFRAGQADFAVSDIPYGLTDGGVLDEPPSRALGYMPIVASATAFVYNLKVGGPGGLQRVTSLRLSGENITKIFTQQITNWSDPAIKADNPGLNLPDRTIVPVVQSDGSDTTAQFTAWMASQYPALWDDYCHRAGRNITPCGFTSYYPLTGTMAAYAGSGVGGFVAQPTSDGAITYIDASAARNFDPVVKMLNAANYYVEPNAGSIAVALLKNKINPDLTSDLSQVYVNPDPRAYPLANYSYVIIPKDTTSHFNTEKGRTLSEFAAYGLCEGQQQANELGYSPLPINLVQAGVDQINEIPGSTHKLDRNNLAVCHNPTISPTGGNLVAENTPQPPECDHKGHIRCTLNPGESVSATVTASPPSPVVVGTTVTLTATVTPSDVDGSVQFRDDFTNTNIGAPAPVMGGVASTTTTLTVGSHELSAMFTPAVSSAGGFATTLHTLTYVVNPPTSTPSPTPPPTPTPSPSPPTPSPSPSSGIIKTTTTLQVAPNPGYTFLPEILIARVSPFNAVGTVQFWDGNTNLGDSVPVRAGIALKFTTLSKGNHRLVAGFNPANPGGCLSLGNLSNGGMPVTPRPCPNANIPAADWSTSSPVSVTVNSLF